MVSPPDALRPAIFLDRDGVLVVPVLRDGRWVAPRALDSFKLYDDAAHQLARLKDAGYLLVVITNQPDIARGLMRAEVLEEMHRRLAAALPVDLILTCPHDNQDRCACRKPEPGMLLEAAGRLNIDLPASTIVGDRTSDIEAGRAAGCQAVFIDLGAGGPKPSDRTTIVRSLGEAVDAILQCPRKAVRG